MAPLIGGAHHISEYVKRVSGSEPRVCGIQPNSGLGEIATKRIRYPEVDIVMPRNRYSCGSAICVRQRGGVVRVLCLGYPGTTRVRCTKGAHGPRRRALIAAAVIYDLVCYTIVNIQSIIAVVVLVQIHVIRLADQLWVIARTVINELSLLNDISPGEKVLFSWKCERLAIIVGFNTGFRER
jgi:hypothetical protein